MAAEISDQVIQLSKELRDARRELKRYEDVLLNIQRSILPEKLPTVLGLDMAVHFAEADGVGGDFYDVIPVSPGRWALFICDVSGHGLAAAAILALVHAIGSAVRGEHAGASPGSALALINGPLAERYLANSGQFVTAFVGLFDVQNQTLTYASAGHPPPRLVRDGEVRRLNAVSGMPLGIVQTSVYEDCVLQLVPGDRLVFFTDGITECSNGKFEMFGEERLDEVVRSPESTAAGVLSRVISELQNFRAGSSAIDDETCLVAVVSHAPSGVNER